MNQVTIQISGKTPEQFVLMLKNSEILKLIDTLKQEFHLKTTTSIPKEFLSIKQGLDEVKLIRDGKLKAKTMEELLDELN